MWTVYFNQNGHCEPPVSRDEVTYNSLHAYSLGEWAREGLCDSFINGEGRSESSSPIMLPFSVSDPSWCWSSGFQSESDRLGNAALALAFPLVSVLFWVEVAEDRTVGRGRGYKNRWCLRLGTNEPDGCDSGVLMLILSSKRWFGITG